MVTKTAGENDAGQRLSRFVLQNTWRLPGGLMYKSFRNKRIKVNGRAAGPDLRLCAGDVVEMYLNDEFFAFPQQPAEQVPLLDSGQWGVVFEDERIAVLYKAGGVLSHSGQHAGEANLLHSYTAHLVGAGRFDPQRENAFSPALCNRLDFGTEGLVVAAVRRDALRAMNELVRDGHLAKHYLAITCGAPPEGVHTAHWLRDRETKTATVQEKPFTGSKPIQTGVTVLARAGRLCLCDLTLYTGRTHQIRAHLALLGAPVLGDKKYGDNRPHNQYAAGPLALCAHELGFSPSIPPDHLLADLAGRRFVAAQAKLPGAWAKLVAEGGPGCG